MKADDLIDLLPALYPPEEFALLPQVHVDGGSVVRTADAIAFGLWRSRGMIVHGFEVKISRADWRRELKNPGKADPIARYCDYWSIVAPAGIVHRDELPETWGLIELRNSKLEKVRPAPRMEPIALDRRFVAQVLRKAVDVVTPKAKIDAAVRTACDRVRAEERERFDREKGYAVRELELVREQIAEFENASGVSLRVRWGQPAGVIGEAVRAVLEGTESIRRNLRVARASATDIVDAASRALEQMGETGEAM